MKPTKTMEQVLLGVAIAAYVAWVALFLFKIDPALRRGLEGPFGARIKMSWTTLLWDAQGVDMLSGKGVALLLVQLLIYAAAALLPLVAGVLVYRKIGGPDGWGPR